MTSHLSWQPRKLFCVKNNVTEFLRFCKLIIRCLRINITLIFMSSSSDGLMHLKKNSKTDVSVGFVPLQGTPTWRLHTWVRFSEYLAYETSHRPDSWRGVSVYIHLFYFPDSGLSVSTGLNFCF